MDGLSTDQPVSDAQNDSQRIGNKHKRLLRVLAPLGRRWNYIEDVLFWRRPKHSLSWLLVLNVLFVLFASSKLRVYIFVALLLLSCLGIDVVRSKAWETLETAGIVSMPPEEHEDQDESQKIKLTSFDDFCKALAGFMEKFAQRYNSLCELRKTSKRKFCAVIVCLLSVLALFFHHAPVVTISYAVVMFGFIWPALGYYGLRRKISSKMKPVFHPLLVQWKYNRTKRERNKTMRSASVNQSISEESEDEEFRLDPEKEEALTKALADTFDVPVAHLPPRQPEISRATSSSSQSSSWDPAGSDTESTLTYIEGMMMPSLADSIDLSIDHDFAKGLEFPDIDKSYSSSMDSLHLIDDETLNHDDEASHTSVSTPNTTDNPGFSDQTDEDHCTNTNELSRPVDTSDQLIWFNERETLIRHRLAVDAPVPKHGNVLGYPRIAHSQQSSTSSEFTDYEVLDHSELDGVNTDDAPPSPGLGVTQIVSSGLSYMGKWVGYK